MKSQLKGEKAGLGLKYEGEIGMKKGQKGQKGKALSLVLVLIMAIFTVTACGKSGKMAEVSVDKIKERGYVVLGLDDTFAPMGFRDAKGELVGFDVELAKEVFKRAGIEVKFQQIDWAMKETELSTGNIDLIWNGYTITDERKEKVSFTKPYLQNKQIVIALADSKIENKEDLKGKKVAAQNGSSTLDALRKFPEILESFDGGEPILFDTNNEAFMDLEAGRSDAVVADEVLAKYYITQKGEENYKVLKEDFGEEEYGIGIRKTDKELLKLVDDSLDAMRADGGYDEIYTKWFGNK